MSVVSRWCVGGECVCAVWGGVDSVVCEALLFISSQMLGGLMKYPVKPIPFW